MILDRNTGYDSDLFVSSNQQDTVDCYCGEEGCLHCIQEETCADDNYWNCDLYPYYALCDYYDYC